MLLLVIRHREDDFCCASVFLSFPLVVDLTLFIGINSRIRVPAHSIFIVKDFRRKGCHYRKPSGMRIVRDEK